MTFHWNTDFVTQFTRRNKETDSIKLSSTPRYTEWSIAQLQAQYISTTSPMKLQLQHKLVLHLYFNLNIRGHTILIIWLTETNQNQIPASETMVTQNINRSSLYARNRTPMNPARKHLSILNLLSTLPHSYPCPRNQVRLKYASKKRNYMVPEKGFDLKPRHLHTCANNHSLTNNERYQLVAKSLKDRPLEFYLKEINEKMPYEIVVDKQRVGYNRPYRKLFLQSEVSSLSYDVLPARIPIYYEL